MVELSRYRRPPGVSGPALFWSYPDFADTFSPEKESEMPTPKPPYPAAFRQQLVELVRAGRGISGLAREVGCNASSIHAWVKAAGGLDGSSAAISDAPLSIGQANERYHRDWNT